MFVAPFGPACSADPTIINWLTFSKIASMVSRGIIVTAGYSPFVLLPLSSLKCDLPIGHGKDLNCSASRRRYANMPLVLRWSEFTKDRISSEGDEFGVYELGNYSDILYIGEGQVFTRLNSHFPGGSDPMVGISSYRVEYTGSKVKAGQRERAELALYRGRYGALPRFNQRRG